MIAASAAATASPVPTPSLNPWSTCDVNPGLPYDRPLGLTFQVLDGPDFDLIKYRGYAVVLVMFATWCPPCNREMPILVDLSNTYSDRGLRIIGIDAREPDDTVRAFRKKYGIPFPIGMDRAGTLTPVLQAAGRDRSELFPTTLMIAPTGGIYCYRIGEMKRDEWVYRIEAFLTASKDFLKTS